MSFFGAWVEFLALVTKHEKKKKVRQAGVLKSLYSRVQSVSSTHTKKGLNSFAVVILPIKTSPLSSARRMKTCVT